MSRLGRGLIGALALGAGAFALHHWATAPAGAPRRATTQLQIVAESFRHGDLARATEAVDEEVSGTLAERYAARLRMRSIFETAHFDQDFEWALSMPGFADLVTTPGSAPPPPPPPPACAPAAGFGASVHYLRPAAPAAGFVEVLDELFALTGRRLAVHDDLAWPTGARAIAVAPGVEPAAPPPAGVRVTWLSPAPSTLARLGKPAPVPVAPGLCRLVSADARFGGIADWQVAVPVQAPVWQLDGFAPEQVLATLKCPDGEHPAVVAAGAGEVVFAFDPLAALIHLRQGDPAQVGIENDHLNGLRPGDLFMPPRERAQMMTPMADLLADAVVRLVEGPGPAPRLWPNPEGKNGTLIITSDQDFAPASQVVAMLGALRAAEVPATVFLTSLGLNEQGNPEPLSPAPAVVDLARTWGFDFAAHTFVPPDRPELGERPALIVAHAQALRAAYGIEPVAIREHAVLWDGYVERAREFLPAGYRWETNYLTVVGKNLPTLGYMTGSGRPLRLYDETGRALPVRQVATQLDDHPDPRVGGGAAMLDGRVAKLGTTAFLGDTLQLVAENARHFHGALVLNNHPVYFTQVPDWLMRAVATARSSGQAVMSFAQYIRHQEGLLASEIAVDASGRSFSICAAHDAQDVLLAGLDAAADVPAGSVRLDGVAVTPRRAIRFGRPAFVVAVPRGTHRLELSAEGAK